MWGNIKTLGCQFFLGFPRIVIVCVLTQIVLQKMPPRRILNPRNTSSNSQNPYDTLFVDLHGEGHENIREEDLPPPPAPPPGGDDGLRDILQEMVTQLVRQNDKQTAMQIQILNLMEKQAQPVVGTQVMVQFRESDPNFLYEKFE